jgi:hypothetical protein
MIFVSTFIDGVTKLRAFPDRAAAQAFIADDPALRILDASPRPRQMNSVSIFDRETIEKIGTVDLLRQAMDKAEASPDAWVTFAAD